MIISVRPRKTNEKIRGNEVGRIRPIRFRELKLEWSIIIKNNISV